MTESESSFNQGKLLHASTDPLVLRPPVGSEVYGNPGVGFRSLFHPGTDNVRHKRVLAIYGFFILFTLAIVVGLLFAMFVLGLGPLSAGSERALRGHSICRVFIPSMKANLLERVDFNDDMMNITMTTDIPETRTVQILHLYSDGHTVLRTKDRCLIRPIRAEITRAGRNYLRHLQRGQLRDSMEAVVDREPWYIQPPNRDPHVIHNSLIMALCQGLPAFRLVSRPPDEYPVEQLLTVPDASRPVESPYSLSPPPRKPSPDYGNSEVINTFLDPTSRSLSDSEEKTSGIGLNRRVRHVDTSHNVQTKQSPGATKTKHDHNQCRMVAAILEDALIPSVRESNVVHVVQDVIMDCSPAA